MKVGLYFHNYTTIVGGGDTFQRETVRAISALSDQSQHQFFVLTYPIQNLDNTASLRGLELVYIEDPLYYRLQRSLRKFRILGRNQTALSPLDFTAQKHHIELIWFLTPIYQSTNVPFIATVWDLQHRLQPWFPEVGNLVAWNNREEHFSTYLKRATYVIVPNEVGREEVRLFYQIPGDRVVCLPHPTPELRSISPEDERNTLQKYGLHPGFLFYPAQYWPHKNHANFLFALKILQVEYNFTPDTVFVGSDKGNLSYLKKLAVELNVQSQIHFLGFVTDPELTAFYKNAGALVYLSYFGPENLPPLEAFSVNCPVIAAKVSGAEEQLGDAALLVNPSHPDEIALAIKSLLEGPKQREILTQRGVARAKQWTAIDYIGQVLSMIDEFELTRRAWQS
jgi:glycosyltransferase involved in cell wall biosynthesis